LCLLWIIKPSHSVSVCVRERERERERERGYITYWVMNLKSSWIIGTFHKQCEKLHFETLQKMMANLVSYSTQCEIWKEM